MTPLIELQSVEKRFELREGGVFGEKKLLRAVDGVDLAIEAGESFGLVGESGCGKSTLGKLVLALEKPTAGRVLFEGKDLNALGARELRAWRKSAQVIFQDPYSSLNPRMTVRQILCEPWAIHGLHEQPGERDKRLARLLDAVGLAQNQLDRYPHEFSGGQRQRIGIARALALEPKLIVADEPVSALDVSIQAQILNLLADLRREFSLTYLFISHDFSVVRHLCDRIAVMYLGRVVELAGAEKIFTDPQHPYTEALLSAVPVPDPGFERTRRRIVLPGDAPSAVEPPPGCRFHPRCRYLVETCKTNDPALLELKTGHRAACPPAPFKDKESAAALTTGG